MYSCSHKQLTQLQLPRLGKAFSETEIPITFAIIWLLHQP